MPETAPRTNVPDELREDLRRDFHARVCTGNYTVPCGCEVLAGVAMTLLTGWAPVIERRAVEAERAAIISGIKDYFAASDDPLYEDVRVLCGRIERGEYGARKEGR